MFKIKPLDNVADREAFCKECGIEYSDGYFYYGMYNIEDGSVMGVCQFDIGSDGGYIKRLSNKPGYDDYEAMFILGRQTMNFIDKCSSPFVRADILAGDERLMRAIGFKRSGNEYICDMTGFFDGNCGCEKNST